MGANVGAEERCLVGSVIASYLETPLFAWQSRYDVDQRGCEMTKECSRSTDCILAYGANLTAQVSKVLLSNVSRGVFLDSCSRHCVYQAPALPMDDSSRLTPTQAFAV